MRTSVTAMVLVCLCAGSAIAEGWWFQAESVTPVSPWEFSTAKSGYMGEGYLYWTGGDTRNTSNGVMAYQFEVTTPGTYVVNIRGRRDQEGECDGAASDQCNDVYTRMNDGDAHKTMIKGTWGQWIWESRYITDGDVSVRPAVYDLEAGTNTFYLSGRSRGVKVDCFVIYLQGTPVPDNPSLTDVAPGVSHGRAGPPVRGDMGHTGTFSLQGRRLADRQGHAHGIRVVQQEGMIRLMATAATPRTGAVDHD